MYVVNKQVIRFCCLYKVLLWEIILFTLVYILFTFVYLCLLLFTGTADEKLELIFRMYDVDNNQTLDKKEFKNMLKSMMDLVRADVDTSKLDRVSKQIL